MENLKAYFTLNIAKEHEEFHPDDDVIEGDYWEFTDPKEVDSWALTMIPHTDNLVFNMKYKNSGAYITLSFDERVKSVINDKYPTIQIHCVTTKTSVAPKDQYHFTILLNFEKIYFNITPLLASLEPTPYRTAIKQLEAKVDKGEFHNQDGTPLTGNRLCMKLTLLFNSFVLLKERQDLEKQFMAPRTLSADVVSQGGSQPSIEAPAQGSQGRGKRNPRPLPSKSPAGRRKSLPASSKQQPDMTSEQSGLGEVSYAEMMQKVPQAL